MYAYALLSAIWHTLSKRMQYKKNEKLSTFYLENKPNCFLCTTDIYSNTSTIQWYILDGSDDCKATLIKLHRFQIHSNKLYIRHQHFHHLLVVCDHKSASRRQRKKVWIVRHFDGQRVGRLCHIIQGTIFCHVDNTRAGSNTKIAIAIPLLVTAAITISGSLRNQDTTYCSNNPSFSTVRSTDSLWSHINAGGRNTLKWVHNNIISTIMIQANAGIE